jgi:hypothetical protein
MQENKKKVYRNTTIYAKKRHGKTAKSVYKMTKINEANCIENQYVDGIQKPKSVYRVQRVWGCGEKEAKSGRICQKWTNFN